MIWFKFIRKYSNFKWFKTKRIDWPHSKWFKQSICVKIQQNVRWMIEIFWNFSQVTFEIVPSFYGDRIRKKCLWYCWNDVSASQRNEYDVSLLSRQYVNDCHKRIVLPQCIKAQFLTTQTIEMILIEKKKHRSNGKTCSFENPFFAPIFCRISIWWVNKSTNQQTTFILGMLNSLYVNQKIPYNLTAILCLHMQRSPVVLYIPIQSNYSRIYGFLIIISILCVCLFVAAYLCMLSVYVCAYI